MKYFVTLRPQPSAPRRDDDSVSGNKAALAYLAELQKKGIFEVGYTFVTGGGAGFLNVASHEELWEIIYNYPGTTLFQWHVEPVADFAQVFSRAIAIEEQEAKK